MERKQRKQIDFDLSENLLKEHYPKPEKTINPFYYKKAYKDISQLMKENGWEHRQYSVYVSKEKLSEVDVNVLMDKIAEKMPWLAKCVKELDETNIGTKRHSLVGYLVATTERLKENRGFEQGLQKEELPAKTSMNMAAWQQAMKKQGEATYTADRATKITEKPMERD